MPSTSAVPRAHAAKILPILLALVASLLVPAQFVAADATSVSIQKTTSASGNQSPGAPYTYTITATTNTAVDDLIVADGAFDYPQIAIESVSYTLNGAGPNKCGSPRPDNIRCPVGSVAAGTTVVVTVKVRVNSNVNVACDKPGAHGTLDSTVLNIAKATWKQAGVPFSRETPRVTVRLDCTGYDPNATPTPTTTILTGPTGNTTKDSATFTFVASPSPTSYRCALDGGSFTTCSSPKTYSGLGLGSHTFEVQGVNATGPGLPVSRDWTAVSPFTDIGSSAFKNDIFWLYNRGITAGCSATKFCPRASVTREQMASFLARALRLPATSRDFFTDDNGSMHQGDINRLAAAGITGGCATGKFCPKALVTREQMASFLARAFKLPVATIDYFSDDNGSIHQGDINRLAKSGITGGCGTRLYCPRANVTREQMAAFLHRAL
ncbi:MAG: S-layer homology domain-containing protein [Candidatus Limnocylindria bacterium]